MSSQHIAPKVSCGGCLEPVDEVDEDGNCADCAYEESQLSCIDCGNPYVPDGALFCASCLEDQAARLAA